jgi:signal transduction histidine kinase
VTNTGPAIAPGDVPCLLEPFRRATAARTHHAGAGHGLGLSIALAITNAHDASLHVTARPSGGLTVTATFPAVAQPALGTGCQVAVAI